MLYVANSNEVHSLRGVDIAFGCYQNDIFEPKLACLLSYTHFFCRKYDMFEKIACTLRGQQKVTDKTKKLRLVVVHHQMHLRFQQFCFIWYTTKITR